MQACAFFRFILITFYISTFSDFIFALKILGITTLPSLSHHLWFTEFMNGLARNGHEIYAVSFENTKFDKDFVTENQTKSFVFENSLNELAKDESFDPIIWSQFSPLGIAWWIYVSQSKNICEVQMATQGAKELLKIVKNTKFDVIIQDLTLGQCFYGLWEIALENPPIVGFTPFGSPNWVKEIVGGNDWPAIKSFCYYHNSPPYNLWERIVNVIYHEIDDIIRRFYYMPEQKELAEKFIGQKITRSMEEIEKNVSVVLTNTYPALETATYLPPNAIEIGGLHIRNPKQLPEDIKMFLDGAEHGAIIISFGTNVKSDILGLQKLKSISTALGTLKQRILWKFDIQDSIDLPKNVLAKKWLPQSDILAHPNVRVLWSHSGLLSTQEAVWRGIPMMGMPFFMDQRANIDLLVKKGVALRLDFESLTTESILKTLERLLHEPSFSQRMKKLSKEYKDRPMSPMDLAIWHVEYTVRHPHSPLASPGKDLSRIQLNLLDVYAVLGIAILLILWILLLVLKIILRLIFFNGKSMIGKKLKIK